MHSLAVLIIIYNIYSYKLGIAFLISHHNSQSNDAFDVVVITYRNHDFLGVIGIILLGCSFVKSSQCKIACGLICRYGTDNT